MTLNDGAEPANASARLDFRGTARRLEPGDIARAARELRCDEATVRALIEVESAARGFGPGGRPIIRFEPHVFRREVARTRSASKVAAAKAARFAAGGGLTQAQRYRTLARAVAIDGASALRATSWGLGQIMGFNHAACGFATLRGFVIAMTVSEGAQLLAMVAFIRSAGLANALAARNWRAFARGYNGPAYARNRYDAKLAAAYARWRRRPPIQRPDPKKETPSMEQKKSPLESIGITGPALGFFVWALNRVFGADVLSSSDVTMLIDALSVVWTAATAIYGRWRATKQVALRG